MENQSPYTVTDSDEAFYRAHPDVAEVWLDNRISFLATSLDISIEDAAELLDTVMAYCEAMALIKKIGVLTTLGRRV